MRFIYLNVGRFYYSTIESTEVKSLLLPRLKISLLYMTFPGKAKVIHHIVAQYMASQTVVRVQTIVTQTTVYW
jgi:hypothetical protein